MTSRLHEELVRTNLADSVEAFDLGLGYGNSLVICTAACAESVSPEVVEEAMMTTWSRFCSDGPTQAELNRAKKAEDREFLSDLASIENRADHISASWSYFSDPAEFNRHLDVIHALGVEDVGATFATWLQPDNRAVLTYRRSR